jgi:hypothetical protein
MIKFHSKVVRVQEMGGKTIVNFKQKIVDSETPDKADDSDEVKMYDKQEQAEDAINEFMNG